MKPAPSVRALVGALALSVGLTSRVAWADMEPGAEGQAATVSEVPAGADLPPADAPPAVAADEKLAPADAPPSSAAKEKLTPADGPRTSATEATPGEPHAADASDQDPNGGYETVAPPADAWVTEGRNEGLRSRTLLSYSTAMPVGSTYHFVGRFSFAGFTVDWRTYLGSRLWAGLSLGWQVLYDKGQRTSQVGDVTLTGIQVRHLNNFPLLATAHYYPVAKEGKLQPYAGFGVGTVASERRVDVGLMTYSSVTWHLGLAPELGVVLPVGSNRFVLTSRFNYAFESGGSPQILYFAFSFGVELQ